MNENSDLPTQFDPATHERAIYERWNAAGLFHAHAARSVRVGGDREPFTIVMPPPNVTAVLHVGHALNNTVQDVVIRWRRMAGDEALWLPGTDHAGIATQNAVEKLVAREGRTRDDLGRDSFVARVVEFVEETGGQILTQLEGIGASCDWSRTAYTLSPELSRAVREAFVRLYERGLIYRGHRVIHWCPRCLTSLSDEEAEFQDTTGQLYHISYPLSDGSGRRITVATTRPETMLGDVAVAVHPEDERYRDLIGTTVRLPIAEVDIPIIADAYTDPAFGSGAVKITPAHDANDFEVGLRHKLPMPVVIDETGHLGEVDDAAGRVPAALQGLDRFEARERIVAMLRDAGRLEKVEPHEHAVRHCYRCDTVVEPRLSDQWFVRMAPLAEPALAGLRRGEIRLLPERWEAVYVNWLENIRDWNISRQLWWGHRIPVFYCEACDPPDNVIVSREDLTQCPHCGGPATQDDDVLDTWFSSWLWPLSTLGWPDERAPDLKAFYPTDLLITAPEILFFWVSRMVMAGYAFEGRTPFHSVYLHGTVRDMNHVKMSKSLGNGIDPLDVVQLYGADALRWTLVAGLGLGTDLLLDPKDLEKSFAPGRNFVTKLWNIGRFLLTNVGGEPVQALENIDAARLGQADRWILARLDAAVRDCDEALGPARPPASGDVPRWPASQRTAGLRLDQYAEVARRFVWNELADWYVEAVKPRLASGTGSAADREVARAVLVYVFDAALRLLHPIVPFVTEALWQRLPIPGRRAEDFLARAPWPRARATTTDGDAFELAREAVVAVRQIRGDYNLPPGRSVDAVIVPANGRSRLRAGAIEETLAVVGRLARASVRVAEHAPAGTAAHALLSDGTEVIVPLAGLIDIEKECRRIRGELEGLEKQLGSLEQRLANESFLQRARPEVVEAERRKREEWTARRAQLGQKVRSLCGD